MNPETVAKTLAIQLGYTDWAFHANLKELSDADGLAAPAGGGNCLDWVAGHVLNARTGCLKMLGMEPPFPADKYDRYGRGSEPVSGADDTVPLTEMVADFAAVQPLILQGLGGISEELLAAPAPFSPSGDESETIGSLLVGLAFHESYHVGQLGAIRRATGHEGVIS